VVLSAWRHLQRIRRDNAALHELPIAALQALTANLHRDTTKRAKPYEHTDFQLFRNSDDEAEQASLSPEVAAVALALRAEGKDAPILLAAWDRVLSSATPHAKPPSIRALHSDDRQVWIVCPTWEGRNIRGGLVAVGDAIHGPALLRDVDRPLATYRVVLPDRRTFAWLESGLLLQVAPEN
jgi:hypothetical protein